MDDSHNISQTKKVDGPCGRCVGRSNNNANANGGLVYSNANNASSNSNANNGSRLNLGNTSDEPVSPDVNRHTANHHELVDDDTVQDRFIETTIKQVPGSGALRIYEFT